MKLKAQMSFSGVLGSAGINQEFEVSDEIGKRMLSDGYPVAEVKPNGRKPRKAESVGDSD